MAQNQGNVDTSQDMLWLIGFLIVILICIWMFFGESITGAYLWVRMQWIRGFQLLFDTRTLSHARYAIEAHSAREWYEDSAAIKALSRSLVPYMMPVLAIPFLTYAWKVFKANPSGRFNRTISRDRLNSSEVRLVPWITPVVGKDLIKEPIDKGPWAMARRPLDFARQYRLLNEKSLDKARAKRLFAAQLGPLWEGPEKLRPHFRALYACIIAQVCKDKEVARTHLMTLARTMSSGTPDYSFVPGLLKTYHNRPEVQEIIRKHAYVTTVMCALLSQSRKVGVLPPNYFLWLRPIHRSLWYSLNCVGRRTPFCEVAGIHAHLLAEQVAGHAIERPFVDHAAEALEKALQEIQYD
jgi:intracellular multiplication protein IcmP